MSDPRRREPPRDPDTVPIPAGELRRRTPEQPWYLAERPRRPQPTPARPSAAPTPAVATAERRWQHLLLVASLAGLLVAGVLAAVLVHRLFGATGATELDVGTAQADISAILTDPINGYGIVDLGDVRCNNGRNPVVRRGAGFSCVVTVGGAQRQVAAVFTDDGGTYQVDRPR